MKKQNDKKGFTIIEVMLVIAIAGLIFMLVFLALPALQRSRRDQQRKTDMSRITSALENYKSNNRGAIPTVGKYVQGRETPLSNAISPDYTKSWDYFYDAYVIVNSAGAKDVFADPSGSPYSLAIQSCKTTGIKPGDDCTVGQRYNVSFDEQSIGTPEEALLNITLMHALLPSSIKMKVVV